MAYIQGSGRIEKEGNAIGVVLPMRTLKRVVVLSYMLRDFG